MGRIRTKNYEPVSEFMRTFFAPRDLRGCAIASDPALRAVAASHPSNPGCRGGQQACLQDCDQPFVPHGFFGF
jgi:hypothetical protein